MTTNLKILYLGTGVFDKGGISRYSRYQIDALRSIVGSENLFVMSLHPPHGNIFEEEILVEKTYSGVSAASKIRFTLDAFHFSKRLGAQVIWSNHVSLCPVSLLSAGLKNGCRTVVNIYGLEIWSGLGPMQTRSLRKCDHIVSDCHFTATWAAENLELRKDRMNVIWDCVDLNRFTPGPAEREISEKYDVPFHPDRIRLMTLGRLQSENMHKGYHRVIQMLSQNRDYLPVDYIIGGTGPALGRLKELVHTLDLNDRVYFTGSISEQDLPSVYRLSDIFVLVSDRGRGRGEGIPLTPLEAAACGKPIIVGNEDGSREAVTDGVNGFILSPSDLQSLADRIHELSIKPEMRNDMGKAARSRIERLHGFERFTSSHRNVINDILEGRS